MDKIQQKEQRVDMLHYKKSHLIEHGLRMNQTMQDNFYKTNAVTKQASLAQPFENHKKEFDNTKEVKPEVKVED